jgi:hypothetical protein
VRLKKQNSLDDADEVVGGRNATDGSLHAALSEKVQLGLSPRKVPLREGTI